MKSSEKTRTQAHKDLIVRNAIEINVQREMAHNQKCGINKSEETVRREYSDLAHKVEREQSAGIYKK